MTFDDFREIWVLDFEFGEDKDHLPSLRCLVAKEILKQRVLRIWFDDSKPIKNPFLRPKNSLFLAYYASAEMGCFLKLKWDLPLYLIDLYAEFRNFTNGLHLPLGRGLLGALGYFGVSHIESSEKEEMRTLALRGGDYNFEERQSLINYCESDVLATEALWGKLKHHVDFSRAIIRGYYIKALSEVEHRGVPFDKPLYLNLKNNWNEIQGRLIEKIDAHFKVFEGRVFKKDRFEEYLKKNLMSWPRLESGVLDLKDETFRQMAKKYPVISPLRELRDSLSKMRLNDFQVGSDSKSRVLLSPFSSKTGRNQPSNSRFVFGSSVWLRSLIKPQKGRGLAYVDWSQQEFGIAGALSKDEKMIESYQSSDPYLSFAKHAGQVPETATKESHPKERSLFKATVLAVQYGMGAKSLAESISVPLEEAKHLLLLHRRTFSKFWRWSEGCVDYILTNKRIWTTFGWQLKLSGEINTRSLANFPMQANGAEMMRIAMIQLVKEGIEVCAPVHDAFLIEAPLENLEKSVHKAQEIMAEASRTVLKVMKLKTDAELISYPDRFIDQERGGVFFDSVMEILQEIQKAQSLSK